MSKEKDITNTVGTICHELACENQNSERNQSVVANYISTRRRKLHNRSTNEHKFSASTTLQFSPPVKPHFFLFIILML